MNTNNTGYPYTLIDSQLGPSFLATHARGTSQGGEFRATMNEAVIETVQTLCREGNRDSVLTVFQNFPEHFSCIPLNDSNVEPKQAINDLLRENVRDIYMYTAGERKAKLSRDRRRSFCLPPPISRPASPHSSSDLLCFGLLRGHSGGRKLFSFFTPTYMSTPTCDR